MATKIIANSDENLVFTPLSDDEPITEPILRAVFTVGSLVIDSTNGSTEALKWTAENEFTVDFRGMLKAGIHDTTLRVFFSNSSLGTVVIDKSLKGASLNVQCALADG